MPSAPVDPTPRRLDATSNWSDDLHKTSRRFWAKMPSAPDKMTPIGAIMSPSNDASRIGH